MSVDLLYCGFIGIVALFVFVERARKPGAVTTSVAGYAVVVVLALLLCLSGN